MYLSIYFNYLTLMVPDCSLWDKQYWKFETEEVLHNDDSPWLCCATNEFVKAWCLD
jgi:hypothetical protein